MFLVTMADGINKDQSIWINPNKVIYTSQRVNGTIITFDNNYNVNVYESLEYVNKMINKTP